MVSAPVHAGIHTTIPPDQRQTPLGADTPPHSACWEIRATSGRYASYWNAYLFINYMVMRTQLYCAAIIKLK